MLTLHPITGGIRDGRHQQYPTPNLPARPVASQAEAEESAVRLFRAYGAISYLRLTDSAGEEVREYRRGDFFQSTSPLRDVHRRVVDQDLGCRATEK
ncbi:hypothetical protein SAM23877_p099 (plasmid) [Streptomyces ambofaciens ATCC 23877]|uniref:Uncharacterized protein n=1 Tax=Streptomyces ambofaciens (strain ATCC 23877 / 3486 / DSM 40053 / JCM 4204 / NBRC 12836 / NRRL B-2516) TaxID=278992 RepID=A0A0K2B6F5_STRA7|nr:hypothetical protein [Streptomyces ambofaciens]AKZ60808.1 hypothetical protein SAM23877_p099 [Streptomyces ambofaciens ATCC 23877]